MRTQAVLAIVLVATQLTAPAAATGKATRVVVDKSDRMLLLYRGSEVLSSYRIALGGEPVGPKRHEGDERTPEGSYVLDRKQAESRFYRAIHISYPNERDRYLAEQDGRPPGGDIMIHGQPNRWSRFAWVTQRFDWTDGCIALANQDMDRVWEWVAEGTAIEINP